MSNGAMDKPRAGRGAAGGDAADGTAAPNPLDSWLKRELQALYGAAAGGELPDEIAELAARLEEKLGRADARRDEAETPSGRGGED